MKLNWINLLATLLILGGVLLLIQRHAAEQQRKSVTVSVSETAATAKAEAIKKIEGKLGRPLNEIEKDMVQPIQDGNRYKVLLRRPLSTRLREAIEAERAATQATTAPAIVDPGQPDGMMEMPQLPATLPTTVP